MKSKVFNYRTDAWSEMNLSAKAIEICGHNVLVTKGKSCILSEGVKTKQTSLKGINLTS